MFLHQARASLDYSGLATLEFEATGLGWWSTALRFSKWMDFQWITIQVQWLNMFQMGLEHRNGCSVGCFQWWTSFQVEDHLFHIPMMIIFRQRDPYLDPRVWNGEKATIEVASFPTNLGMWHPRYLLRQLWHGILVFHMSCAKSSLEEVWYLTLQKLICL